MNPVAAPKKELTSAMRERLERARDKAQAADVELWSTCAAALEEGTYDEVAAVVGVARSTLQEKVRKLR